MSRDFIQVIGAAAALAAVIIAGMALVVSMTVAPVREDMRLLHEDMRSLRTEIQSEFKTVRSDMADIRERLARVELLLERDMGQPDADSDAQP